MSLTFPATDTMRRVPVAVTKYRWHSSSINTASFNQKTFAVRFTTGSDITSRQFVYEQGGGSRGLSVYVYNGRIYTNMWFAGSNIKSANTPVSANTTYHATIVLDNPNLTFYVDGSSIGSVSDATTLNSHGGDISITGNDGTRTHDGSSTSTSYLFGGTVHEILQYNSAISGSSLTDLHQYFDCS